MAKKHPTRKGFWPDVRPTEWTTAIVMLWFSAYQFYQDRNMAAFMATVGAFLPAIVTAITSWWESRHAETTAVVPAVKDE